MLRECYCVLITFSYHTFNVHVHTSLLNAYSARESVASTQWESMLTSRTVTGQRHIDLSLTCWKKYDYVATTCSWLMFRCWDIAEKRFFTMASARQYTNAFLLSIYINFYRRRLLIPQTAEARGQGGGVNWPPLFQLGVKNAVCPLPLLTCTKHVFCRVWVTIIHHQRLSLCPLRTH